MVLSCPFLVCRGSSRLAGKILQKLARFVAHMQKLGASTTAVMMSFICEEHYVQTDKSRHTLFPPRADDVHTSTKTGPLDQQRDESSAYIRYAH